MLAAGGHLGGSGTAPAPHPAKVPAPTAATTPGPYYLSGTPELANGELNYTGLPGEPIKITGHVLAATKTMDPIEGAKIEIWHSDSQGLYHPEGSGDAGRYRPDELGLRGYVLTDRAGAYQFTTIYPGAYRGRTRHIHVRASAEGYSSVVTQIIVPAKPGDPTSPENDFVARRLPPANHVTFVDEDGIPTARFDFFLVPA